MHSNKVGCCVIKRCTAASLTTLLGAPPPHLSCCLSLVAPHWLSGRAGAKRSSGPRFETALALKVLKNPGLSLFSTRQSMLYCSDTLPPGVDRPGESQIRRLHLCLRGLTVSGAGRSQFSHTSKVLCSPRGRRLATHAYVTPLIRK